jgi:hypothetical protein
MSKSFLQMSSKLMLFLSEAGKVCSSVKDVLKNNKKPENTK